jgi:crotonobetainyl-CoA:carnitine CoA-transferase CaiB-like acyl-CoA transferase
VLGCAADRDEVAAAVSRWAARELEDGVVAAGGCAAELRSPAEWAVHPQGRAVAAEPLVDIQSTGAGTAVATAWRPAPNRPLAGLRVLDLTRVLAGPVATRALAGLGAEVLRIDPPWWDEESLELDMTLGKRCARLDLRDPDARDQLEQLLTRADVLVHGYRPGALDRLGLDAVTREHLRPGLVEVSLSAYGHTGPWASRRGFDSLVQMSSGVAAEGLLSGRADRPTPLPVQALDHATGWLMAAAAIIGLASRQRDGAGTRWRLSLARTAVELESARSPLEATVSTGSSADRDDHGGGTEVVTAWGPAELLQPPLGGPEIRLAWDLAPRPLGSDAPVWLD